MIDEPVPDLGQNVGNNFVGNKVQSAVVAKGEEDYM